MFEAPGTTPAAARTAIGPPHFRHHLDDRRDRDDPARRPASRCDTWGSPYSPETSRGPWRAPWRRISPQGVFGRRRPRGPGCLPLVDVERLLCIQGNPSMRNFRLACSRGSRVACHAGRACAALDRLGAGVPPWAGWPCIRDTSDNPELADPHAGLHITIGAPADGQVSPVAIWTRSDPDWAVFSPPGTGNRTRRAP